jgi:hypothetical protein
LDSGAPLSTPWFFTKKKKTDGRKRKRKESFLDLLATVMNCDARGM